MVSVGGITNVNATMSLATLAETITVSADVLPATSAVTTSQTYGKREIDALPVGRRPADIAEFAPSVSNPSTTAAGQVLMGGAFGFDNVFMVPTAAASSPLETSFVTQLPGGAARDDSSSAFDERRIRAACVAPRSRSETRLAVHLEPANDHGARFIGEVVCPQGLGRDQNGIVHIGPELQLSANGPTEIVDEHEVIPNTTLLVQHDAIEDLDDGTHLNVQARLLSHLTRHASFERLTQLQCAARQTPMPRQWLVPALDEHDPSGIDDDRANPHDRALGVLTSVGAGRHSPMTFTTTRFRRCPSNSA